MLRIDAKDESGETNTTCLRDSADIVKYINAKYPEPPVDIDGPINDAFANFKHKPGRPFGGLVLTAVPDYLSERSSEYFHRTRKDWLGCSISEFRQKRINEGAWKEMEDWANEARELLRKNGGPFFLGEKLSLLDIRLVGLLKWAEITGHREDYEKIVEFGGPEFERFWQAAQPWIKKDD